MAEQDPFPLGFFATVTPREAVAGTILGVDQTLVRDRRDLVFVTGAQSSLRGLAQAGVAILAGAAYPSFATSHRASPSGEVRIVRQATVLPPEIPAVLFPFRVGWQAWQVVHPILTAYGKVGGRTRPVSQAVSYLEMEITAALVAAGMRSSTDV